MTKKAASYGAQLIAAMTEAVEIEHGGRPAMTKRVFRTARSTKVEAAPRMGPKAIAKLRASLELSQPVFADVLNVSRETLRAWEQGKRNPDGAATRLLQLVKEHPALLLAHVRPSATPGETTRAFMRDLRAGKLVIRNVLTEDLDGIVICSPPRSNYQYPEPSMSNEPIERQLIPLANQSPPPERTLHQKFLPVRVEDRGEIDFVCPTCGLLIIEGMNEQYIPRAPAVYCGNCKMWMSPSGEPSQPS